MPKKNAINLNFDTSSIEALIKEFVNLQRAANAPTEQIEKILKDLYKLQDVAKNGTPLTVNALNSITSRLAQFGAKMKDSFSTDYIETLTKKVNELKKQIADSEVELQKLKKTNPTLKGNVTRFTNQQNKLLSDTLSSGLFENEAQLRNFSRGNVTKTKDITDSMNEEERATAELYNKRFEAAKNYIAQQTIIEEKLKTAKKLLQENEKEQNDIVEAITKQKNVLGEIIDPNIANNLVEAGKSTSNLSDHLRKTVVESDASGNSLVTLSNSANVSSMSFGKMAKSMVLYKIAIRGVKKLISSAVQTFKDMDNAITNMAIVTGRSREELWGMTSDFKNLAQQAGSTMTEMADLTTEYVRQGRAMSEAKILAVETAKAAKIAGISVSDSLTYMTSAINGFNLAASDASRVSDIFAKVAAVSATNYNQLAIALSKVSAQANQAGMSIEYTTALLAKGIETTQEAPESIGTALKTIIARFRELSDYGSTLEDGMNVNNVEAALKAVGIQLRNESGEFRDLTSVLNELGPKWDSLTTMQRQAIAQAAAGTRQQSRFLAIMQDWDRTMELVDSAQNSAGASAAQYAKYAEGLTATLTNLKTTWQEFTTKVVNSEFVVKGLQTLNKTLTSISNGLSEKTLQPMLAGLVTILGIYKTIDLYNKYRLSRAAQLNKLLQDEGYEEELNLARATKSTLEFQKYAKEREKAHLDNIEKEKISLEAGYQEMKQNAENLKLAKLQTLETEKNARIKNAKTQEEISAIEVEFNTRKTLIESEHAKELSIIESSKNAELKALDEKSKRITELSEAASNSVGLGGSSFISSFASVFTKFKNIFSGFSKSFKEAKVSGNSFWNSFKKGASSSGKALKTAGIAAGIAATVYAISQVIQTTQELRKTSQDYINDINSLYGEIGSLYNENDTLNGAIEEYTLLENKINKTAAEQERLNELSKAFAAGDYGEDVTDINSARSKYTENDAMIEEKYSEILSKAMRAAAKEGSKILDESEFLVSLKEIAKREITIKVTDAQTKKAKEVTQSAMENYDFEAAYGKISQDWAKKNTSSMAGMDWGAALKDFAVLTGGGAAFGASIGVPWGALIGGIIGSVAAIGTTIYRQTATYKNEVARTTAAEMERMIAKTTQDVQKFALAYGETAEESLEKQYENFKKLMNSGEYTTEAKNLVSSVEKGFSDLMDLGFTPERIKKLKGEINTITDATFKEFIDLASNYGKEGSKAFYKVWEDLVDYYKGDALKISADLYRVINGLESNAEKAGASISKFDAQKYSRQAVKQAEKEADAALDAYTNIVKGVNAKGKTLSNDDKRVLALEYGLNIDDIKDDDFMKNLRDAAKERYDVEVSEATNLADTFKQISEAALNTISTFGSFNELSQGLTGLQSVFENISSFRDELENGTISLENLNTVATQYADVLGSNKATQAIESGNYKQIADLLGGVSTVSDMVNNQREMINDFIERQKAELDVAIDQLDKNDEDYKEQVKALEDNTQAQINAAELYAKMYYQISETQQIVRNREYAARAYERGIENGDLTAYVQRSTVSKEILADYKKDYESFKYDTENNLSVMAGNISTTYAEIFDDILEGSWDLYNSLSEADKETFYAYSSTLDDKEKAYYDYTLEVEKYDKEYQDKLIEIQNEAMDAYKENLKKETDELKKQIDKRKEYYEDFFDLLDKEEETEDYETERTRLLNTISSLSTARDANSLARLKEAQTELAELEKEQRSNERETRKEATLDALDSLSEQVDEEYEKTIENNAAIWDAFQEKGDDVMLSMIKKWKMAVDGYNNMTKVEKEQWDANWATYVKSYDSASSSSDLTNDQIAELSKSGQISTANDTSNGLWNYNPTPTTENNNEYNSLVIENLSLELPSVTDGQTFIKDFPQLLLEIKRSSGQTINSKN